MEKLLELSSEFDMLPPGETVLCALSGGADSVCLAHLLWRAREPLGISLVAAHYNHHLRGDASQRDAAFVIDFCAGLGLPLILGEGDVAAAGGNTEQAARDLRYAFLQTAAHRAGATRIATAHNADDNLESLLLNLTRGCGLGGLSGIPPRRGNIVRPLLTTARAEILDYLALHALDHVEDATNADDAYARNRIRNRVLPVLRSLNPQVVRSSAETLSLLRQDDACLSARAAALSRQALRSQGAVLFPVGLLQNQPPAVASRCVRALVGMAQDGDTRVSGAHTAALLALALGGDPSARISLPRGITASRDYDLLCLSASPPPSPFAPLPLHEGENPIPGTDWTVTLGGDVPGLVARPRQSGDKLTLPKVGTKTIQNWMVERKIPVYLRPCLPVVANDDGVLALAGFGMNPGHPLADSVVLTIARTKRPCQKKDG